MSSSPGWGGPILVVGGTGVFGSRLALGLIADGHADVVVAGRDGRAAAAFCAAHGGRPLRLDRGAGDLAARLSALGPAIVIDAAGPFQDAGPDPHALARAAIACGAHYLDLSDDAGFTAAIGALDGAARARGVAVLSGASSVPALSSAAADALARGLMDVHLIESVILPGNRAPRGLSVVRAILTQAGRPLRLRQGGHWTTAPGWSGARREALAPVPGAAPLGPRWSSVIGAPDLLLFPARYGARSVAFRAGLELGILHGGLGFLAWLPRLGLVRSLSRLARPARWAAALLERLGTDRGGMEVRVLGTDVEGRALRRTWTLLAEAGDGPHVPALAARILCGRLLRGEVAPGARPALGEATLAEVEALAARSLRIAFGRHEHPDPPLFARALGPAFAALPPALRDLHAVLDERRWSGRADVGRGASLPARVLAALMRFPPPGRDVPVTVVMRRDGADEVWTRDFAGRRFSSRLSLAGAPGTGTIHERLGPVRVEVALAPAADALAFPVVRGTVLGVPLPRWLLPVSDAVERVRNGRATFDVRLSMPLIGEVASYRGWLEEVAGRP